MHMPRLSSRALLVLASIAVLSAAPPVVAQPPPPPPNPKAPTLAMPAPLGMQRGTRLDLTLTGNNLAEPTALWTSFPAKVTIPTENNNGKDNAKLLVQLDVAADAPLGFHSLRLATKHGMSNVRLFCIDDLPQVLAVDTNRVKATPQAVTAPCVAVGRVDAEVSSWYKIHVTAGQRLSFDVLGRRLGSAFDPQLTLRDAKTGDALPGGHCEDAPGCQSDPRLTYTFKEAGDYLIEVRDAIYRGGPDFWYRLRIGDFPCATTPIPLAGRRGSKVSVHFAGPNVEGVAPVEVPVPADIHASTVWVAPKGTSGLYGWPVALAVSDTEELVEQEPNDTPDKANRVPVPCGISGRLDHKRDLDHFVFAAKKGQRLVLDGHTLEAGSPTLLYLGVLDAKGAELARSNPQALPPLDQHVDFTAPADGDFVLAVQHLNYQGGPSESYRVTIAPYEPGFNLSLGLDRFDVAPGAGVAVPLGATRRDYAGPIEVSVVAGHPGITGTVTIGEGKPAAPNQPAATLVIQASPDVPMGAYSLLLQGKATINGHSVVEYVSVRPVISQGLANLPYPPEPMFAQVGLAVTERPPLLLTAKFDAPDVLRGGQANVTIAATRAQGLDDEIVVTVAGLPANVAPALKNIPKGQTEVKVQLNVAANAALGQFPITFAGKAKFQGKEVAATTLPVSLNVAPPFELQVSGPLKLKAGEQARLKVQAVRKGAYAGPIALEVRNLPANVTAEKVTIEAGKNEAEIVVSAAATAAPGDKGDVNVLGSAPAAANQQNGSVNFTVSIVK